MVIFDGTPGWALKWIDETIQGIEARIADKVGLVPDPSVPMDNNNTFVANPTWTVSEAHNAKVIRERLREAADALVEQINAAKPKAMSPIIALWSPDPKKLRMGYVIAIGIRKHGK